MAKCEIRNNYKKLNFINSTVLIECVLMNKYKFHLSLVLATAIMFIIKTGPIHAVVDPLAFPNNKFGLHILHESELEEAMQLVNSTGGEWGYITTVIRSDERNITRWQDVFDEMREKKLIPIVRIASKQAPNGWEKLDQNDIENWVYFLNSLNWVVQNRYVTIGNEPNHASEWGGEVNPEEYADYLYQISKSLKTASEDFFILPAGFDASAPDAKRYMSQSTFIEKMIRHNPNVFEYINGWASHSYPNPGFSGSVSDIGRGTIRTYEWEMKLLRSLGIEKHLPIFIKETGWAHNMNTNIKGLISPEEVGDKLKFAFENVWIDPKIVAITPFILNYQESPFNIFSWKDKDGQLYDFYYKIKEIEKQQGQPLQRTSGKIISVFLPDDLYNQELVSGFAVVENTGQKIWKVGQIDIKDLGGDILLSSSKNIKDVYPFEKAIIFFDLKLTYPNKEETQLNLNINENSITISHSYRLNKRSGSIETEDDVEDENKPRFRAVRTVLPIVLFKAEPDDKLSPV